MINVKADGIPSNHRDLRDENIRHSELEVCFKANQHRIH